MVLRSKAWRVSYHHQHPRPRGAEVTFAISINTVTAVEVDCRDNGVMIGYLNGPW